MLKTKKMKSLSLAVIMTASVITTTYTVSAQGAQPQSAAAEWVNQDTNVTADVSGPDSVPKQVNAHIGEEPSTQINLTYTTVAQADTKVTYNPVGQTEKLEAVGTSSQGAANKYFHGIALTGLTPNTQYEYTVGTDSNTYSGKFKTAPAKGSKESFKFAYIADTQVSNATNAKALGATLNEVSKIDNLSFVYLAGDHTDTATNEMQWELLFNNSGAFPNGGQDMYGNNTVAVVQGNHDNNTLQRHINVPGEEGDIVYAYDYGPATFIMINLETARYDADARAKQAEFVKRIAKDAKERGQWTAVGFHKSIYTGASHITDGDVTEARKYWAPIFTELDIDMVLQGHDHVYSRGFVNADGHNANPVKDTDNKVIDPVNAPLYMVGGHAGGLKWYSKKNYTVGTGDPLSTGYSFLDVNSTDTGSDVNKEQVIIEMEISNEEYTINTYMFKYDTNTDTITKPKYLYDTVTVKREVSSANLSGSVQGATEIGEELSYNVSLSDINNVNAFQVEVQYDQSKMDFVNAKSVLENTILENVEVKDGIVKLVLGTSKPVNAVLSDVAKLTFKLKTDLEEGETEIVLKTAKTATASSDGMTATDNVVYVDQGIASTEIYSYQVSSDINQDHRISLSDLSIALANYQKDNKLCDINRDGKVNAIDFIIMAGYVE